MRAAVANTVGGGFAVEDVDLADPVGAEVVVDIRASGLCHSDLTMASQDIGYPLPAVFGHELAGVVVATGPAVTTLAVGDHVVGSLIQSCGSCANCARGRTYRCLHPQATLRGPDAPPRLSRGGVPLHQAFGLGGFAERAVVHELQLARIPDAVPFAPAALLGCAVATGAGAVLNTADVQVGDTVAVIGAGGVGLNAISAAVIAGASRIVAVDLTDAKLKRAAEFGATDLVNADGTDAAAAVVDLTGGVDHVFDFVGTTAVTEGALAMLGVGGGLYLVGMAQVGTTFTVDMLAALGGQRRIQGVYMGSSNFRHDVPRYAELYLRGRLALDDLVSREISLDQVDEGYAALRDGSLARVVITST